MYNSSIFDIPKMNNIMKIQFKNIARNRIKFNLILKRVLLISIFVVFYNLSEIYQFLKHVSFWGFLDSCEIHIILNL